MQVADMTYLLDTRNRPGRAALIQYKESPFDSGTLSAGGADISFTLPKPSQGFVRSWEMLMLVTASAIVAADKIFLTRISQDFSTGTVLQYYFGLVFAANDVIPLISGRTSLVCVPGGGGLVLEGINPIIIAPEDNLTVFVDYSAPVAQQINIRAWYKDLPI